MHNKIEHKSKRDQFIIKIQTDDAMITEDIAEYNKGTYVIPESTVNELIDMTVDAITFNSNDDRKFVEKIFEHFNKNQLNEALLYLSENLGVKIVED